MIEEYNQAKEEYDRVKADFDNLVFEQSVTQNLLENTIRIAGSDNISELKDKLDAYPERIKKAELDALQAELRFYDVGIRYQRTQNAELLSRKKDVETSADEEISGLQAALEQLRKTKIAADVAYRKGLGQEQNYQQFRNNVQDRLRKLTA